MSVMMTADRRSIVRYPFVVAALSLISTVVYVYRLGKPSFWFDESASYVNARLSWHDFGIAMHHRDVFFAAYYAFLHLWMSMGSDEAMLRMPSVIGAVAALPCMFALGSRLFGNRAGLAAMILLASDNLFIEHVREARPYAWLVLFAILSSLTFSRALDSGRSRDWTWYVAACAVGAYVHIFALLVPISHGVSLAFLNGNRPWKQFFLSFGAIAAAAAPLVFLIIGQESTSGRVFAGYGNPRDLVYLFRIFCGSKVSALLYAGLGVFIFAMRRRRASRIGDLVIHDDVGSCPYAFLGCWMLVPPGITLAVSHFVPVFLETYLLVSLPPLLLLVAAAVATLRDARIVVFATLLFVGLNLPGALKTYEDHGEKEDWRGAVAAVTSHASPDDALAVLPATDAASLEYYEKNLAERDLPTLVYPNMRTYRIWLPAPAIDTSATANLSRRYARVWVLANQDAPEANARAVSLERMFPEAIRLVRTEHFTGIVVTLYENARR